MHKYIVEYQYLRINIAVLRSYSSLNLLFIFIFIIIRFYTRCLTSEEIIQLLEDDDFTRADIYITPPVDGLDSEEDSGDEEGGGNVNNLSGKQLQSEATFTVVKNGETIIHECDDGKEAGLSNSTPCQVQLAKVPPPTSPPPSPPQLLQQPHQQQPQKQRQEPQKQQQPRLIKRKWIKCDLQVQFPLFTVIRKSFTISEPVEMFQLFFDDEVCTFIKDMTELYAQQDKGDHTFSVTIEEIRCFLAILLLSGYINVPRWRMLWETNSETYNNMVANAMRRNRFEQIKRYCHCSDNQNLQAGDKFAKVRPLMAMLNEKYLNFTQFQQHLSVDESMVPYFGRHGAKQFLRGKPIRFGYKMWALCDSIGYLIQFEPYQGKVENRSNTDLGVGGSVVMDLISELPQQPFKLYCDRFFSSLKLVNRLQNSGIGMTGTIMGNRIENSPIVSPDILKKQSRGTFDYRTDTTTNCTVTTWNDNRVVTIVSSVDPVFPIGKANRWVSSEKRKIPVNQPNVIAKYNKYMGGVDRMDQNIENYRIGIRSKKWWWPIFAFCIDTSIHNAWQLHRRSNTSEQLDLLTFRRRIVCVYLRKYGILPVGGGRPKTSKELDKRVPNDVRFDRIDHWIVSAEKQNRCGLCRKNATKACEKCKVNLHDFCFKNWHTK